MKKNKIYSHFSHYMWFLYPLHLVIDERNPFVGCLSRIIRPITLYRGHEQVIYNMLKWDEEEGHSKEISDEWSESDIFRMTRSEFYFSIISRTYTFKKEIWEETHELKAKWIGESSTFQRETYYEYYKSPNDKLLVGYFQEKKKNL